jgi:glycosyltransferase involved in cell wall biosynthesis
MNPLRILFVFGCPLKKGGTENVMINIVKNIDREMFHIDFLIFDKTPDTSDDKKYLESLGCRFYQITARGIDRKIHNKELEEFFKEHKYDIVHTHMDAIGEEALKAAKKHGIKARIAHSHNTDQLDNPKGLKDHLHRAYLKYEKHLLRRYAEYYVACSPEAGKWLFGKKRCSGDNYLLLTNAVESSKYSYDEAIRDEVRKELGIEGKKVIIHVGQFRTQKNHDKVIEIFRELCSRDEAYRLILVGKGEDEYRIRDMVSRMGLSGKVRFLGNRNDVDRLLQAADVFLFPSLYEGLSIALLEAQASDLICIVSDTVSPASFVTEKAVSLGLDKDAKTWADKIESALDEYKTRSDMKSLFTEKGYDISAQIKVLEKFYIKAAGI